MNAATAKDALRDEREVSGYVRRLVDHVPSMLAYWDRDLRCRFANRAYERWFGVDPDSLIGTTLPDLLGPELHALNEPHIRGALRGEPQVFERVVPGPDGVRRHSLARYIPDFVDGVVAGFMVEVTEVTPLKEAEARLRSQAEAIQRANDQLRASESALRQAQRLGQIGSWEWDLRTDHVSWSDELYRILGLSPARALPAAEERRKLYSPESWARLQAAVDRTLATGEPYLIELEFRRPDGTSGWIEARGEAVRGEDGQVARLFGTALDVTARHRVVEARAQREIAQRSAEAAALRLRYQEEQWHELFKQASEGIFIADLQGRYIDVNGAGCALLGYTRDELIGKTIVDLIPPEDVPRLAASKVELLAGAPHVAEWSLKRKDGRRVPAEVSAKILSDGRWIALVRDITERRSAMEATRAMAEELERRVLQRTEQLRRLAAELEAAENRERRQLSRDLHDDLGQMLAAARIRLESLRAAVPETARAAVGEIAGLIDRANRSTRSLAAQLAPAMLYELGLTPALEWLAEEVGRDFGLTIRVLDDGSPKPLSHEARSILYRATRELLINAAKHARSNAAATEVRRIGDRIVVQVTDAGVGFDPDALATAPQRGLGLVSVRERLSFIGGTAEIRSVPGDGTIAVLSAPLATGQLPEEQPAT